MKKNIIKLILFSCLLIVGQQLLAQSGPPNPPGDPSTGGNEVVGGNAPIGGGLELLLVMALAYGSKKTYNAWKSKELKE